MSFSIRKWASSLALSFALFAGGCREEKTPPPYVPPAIYEQTIQNSIANTDTGTVALQDGEIFRYRLKYIIDKCSPQDLQTLKDHNVTIDLDQRLSAQGVSFFYPTVEAAYYRQGDAAVLSLWDDGKRECMDNLYYLEKAPELVHQLADRLRAGSQDTLLFGGRFKNAAREKVMVWKMPLDFSKKTFKKNPQLLAPPPKAFADWIPDQALLDKINPPVIHPTMKELGQKFREMKEAIKKFKEHRKKKKHDHPEEKQKHEPRQKHEHAARVHKPKTEHQDLKPALADLKQHTKELKQEFKTLKETLKHRKDMKAEFKKARKKRKAEREALKKMCPRERKKHAHSQ
ncbi:MAG: hypothetical protein K8R48_08660 [Alphaproteobacteria bacterium]|nr:hypothetical protein [Alphaproteobacteria bacterium]